MLLKKNALLVAASRAAFTAQKQIINRRKSGTKIKNEMKNLRTKTIKRNIYAEGNCKLVEFDKYRFTVEGGYLLSTKFPKGLKSITPLVELGEDVKKGEPLFEVEFDVEFCDIRIKNKFDETEWSVVPIFQNFEHSELFEAENKRHYFSFIREGRCFNYEGYLLGLGEAYKIQNILEGLPNMDFNTSGLRLDFETYHDGGRTYVDFRRNYGHTTRMKITYPDGSVKHSYLLNYHLADFAELVGKTLDDLI